MLEDMTSSNGLIYPSIVGGEAGVYRQMLER